MFIKIFAKKTTTIVLCMFMLLLIVSCAQSSIESKTDYQSDSSIDKWKKYNWSEYDILDNHVKSEKCYDSSENLIYDFEYSYNDTDNSALQKCYNCDNEWYASHEYQAKDLKISNIASDIYCYVEYDSRHKKNRQSLDYYNPMREDAAFTCYYHYDANGYKSTATYTYDSYWDNDGSGLKNYYKEKPCTFEYKFDEQDRCMKELCYFEDGTIAYYIDYEY